MEVGIVVDIEVPAAADDEGVIDADAVHLAGEVQDQFIGTIGVDVRQLGPGQIAHV